MNPKDLTTEQKIEASALFMGWDLECQTCRDGTYEDEECVGNCLHGMIKLHGGFNPLEDENHFRMVLEKVMEDEKARVALYLLLMEDAGCIENVGDNSYRLWHHWNNMPRQERVDALISVLPERDE